MQRSFVPSRMARVLGLAALLCCASARADEVADINKLLRAGQLPAALAKVDVALAQHPKDAQLRFIKGMIFSEQGKATEAIAIFQKLSEDFPELPEPYNNLAVLYAGSGQYDKARVALERAIRTNPTYATAHENLGDVYAKLASQSYDKAMQLLDSAPQNPPPKSKLAMVRTLKGPAGPQLAATPSALPPAAAGAASSAPANSSQAAQAPARPALPAPAPAPIAAAAVTPAATRPPASAPVTAQPPAAAKPAAPTPTTLVAATAKSRPGVPASTAAGQPAATAAKPTMPPTTTLASATATTRAGVPATATAPAAVQSTGAARTATSAAAAAPAVQLAKAEPTKTDSGEKNDVNKAVDQWAKSWSAQDMKGYLNAYASNFQTPHGQSRQAWAADRSARIEGKEHIKVTVEAPQITVNGNTATVKFRQIYVSDRLKANSRKTLVMEKQGNKWLIKQEQSGG
jgi:ketosteroid isomerase-like protein